MVRMALLVLLAACSAGGGDDYPARPGIGGPGASSGGGADAGLGDGGAGDAGGSLRGRVCVLNDLRKLTECATSRVGALKVALGPPGAPNARTAMTADDGTFQITPPLGTDLVWHVSGAPITTSVMPFGADNTIPAVLGNVYQELLLTNGMLTQDEAHGSVVVRVVSGTAPVAGVSAQVSPLADSLTYYDAENSLADWTTSSTGPAGVIWVPSVPLPSPQVPGVTLTLTRSDGATRQVSATVESQAITFLTRDVQ